MEEFKILVVYVTPKTIEFTNWEDYWQWRKDNPTYQVLSVD